MPHGGKEELVLGKSSAVIEVKWSTVIKNP